MYRCIPGVGLAAMPRSASRNSGGGSMTGLPRDRSKTLSSPSFSRSAMPSSNILRIQEPCSMKRLTFLEIAMRTLHHREDTMERAGVSKARVPPPHSHILPVMPAQSLPRTPIRGGHPSHPPVMPAQSLPRTPIRGGYPSHPPRHVRAEPAPHSDTGRASFTSSPSCPRKRVSRGVGRRPSHQA